MNFKKFAAACLAATALIAVPASAATGSAKNGLTLMKGLNVIVLQDLNAGGGEIEGKAYVGGNVNGNSFQIGFGNSAYGQAQSFRSTLAVGGNLNAQIQLSNGPNGSISSTIDHFGAYIVGNVAQKLNLNSNAATVRVGGNLKDMNYTNGTRLDVGGSVTDTLALGDNSVTRIGGNASGFNSGNNNVVLDVRGAVGNLGIGTGTVRIGGALGNTSGGNNINLSVGGAIGNGSLGSNAFVKANGNVNVNGTGGATIYTAGAFTGNANGATIHQGATAFSGGVTAPTTPNAPPAVDSLVSMTAQIKADVEALSTALGVLATTNTLTTAAGNPGQIKFTVSDTDPNVAAVFNLTAAQFAGAQQFQFNFANLNKPVVFNVSGAVNGVYNWNATASSSNPGISVLQNISQNVVWNFLDATTLNINREVYGSVLAAKAVVSAGSNINGTVVAKIFNQSAEVHLGTYARGINFLPNESVSATPEPAVWVQLITGFGFTGALMRRRRTTVVA